MDKKREDEAGKKDERGQIFLSFSSFLSLSLDSREEKSQKKMNKRKGMVTYGFEKRTQGWRKQEKEKEMRREGWVRLWKSKEKKVGERKEIKTEEKLWMKERKEKLKKKEERVEKVEMMQMFGRSIRSSTLSFLLSICSILIFFILILFSSPSFFILILYAVKKEEKFTTSN